ncbi:MAG: alpha/beta hydrolase family protein [Planctomycetota bacterium]|jgi:dienelactone hydrolase
MRALTVLLIFAAVASAERVRIPVDGGKKVTGEFLRGKQASAVLCLAERGKSKAMKSTVEELKALGSSILVMEPRSHRDVGAALDFLESKKGCDRSCIAVVGRGRSGAIAFHAASVRPEDFRVVALLGSAADYGGIPIADAAKNWRGTSALTLDCADDWAKRLGKYPASATKGTLAEFVRERLLDVRVPHWREQLGKKSSPQAELDLAVKVYLGDVVARRRVGHLEYALLANERSGGRWSIKARVLPTIVDPDSIRTIISYHGRIRFHIGKESFEFTVQTKDPKDPFGAVTLLRKARSLKGTGPGGAVEAKLMPWSKPEGIALAFDRRLTSPAALAIEFVPKRGKPIRLPQGDSFFRASVQTLWR